MISKLDSKLTRLLIVVATVTIFAWPSFWLGKDLVIEYGGPYWSAVIIAFFVIVLGIGLIVILLAGIFLLGLGAYKLYKWIMMK